ncbi:class I SAM-dependent methyltransferase [Pseudaminobacter soli (ex Li et al. 2025)]|uniref:Ubiquinone biosynthesis protein n=1 Tax=Pseudaminobacter soli (ex Li et al. 2025) TaxID=1295366 RepID=A0A2P7S724_9HYPH|nr:class I SAM-dependent methyltransferase [Mesorhizobium soli]PSJ58272.1 ubiquinone biosynthesis protein [Mesorhizobium soli]
MTTEEDVARHYSRGALERTILDALRNAGKDIDRLQPSDLSAADEFHLGWRAATAELANDLALSPGMRLLDIGSGIGGPARYFAEQHGVNVIGVDLTEEFVAVATALTARCGLADRVSFVRASALSLPFADGAFERATLIHVGMNIDDKAGAMREIHRVLGQDGIFAVYDVMVMGDGELPYPMPWAETPATSFVETPDAYRQLLEDAGFAIEAERNRREMVLELNRQMREDVARNGPPPLGLHTVMGAAAPVRVGNLMAALSAGTVAPIQMLARKR